MSSIKFNAAYGQSNAIGKTIPLSLWQKASEHRSLNGFYIADTGVKLTAGRVETWYDLSGSTNYLKQLQTSQRPYLVSNDAAFNFNKAISFATDGSNHLIFDQLTYAGTIILVYNAVIPSSAHPILSYRQIPNTSPPVYYDMLPRSGTTMWATSPNSNNYVYNATTRINAQQVLPSYALAANQTRILSIHNFDHLDYIQGIGGKYTGSVTNSVQGKISAILTFEENLTSEAILELELELQKLYINYNGPVFVSNPPLKYLVNDSVNVELSSFIVDEWFDIVNVELLSPLNIGISISGTTLIGTLTNIFEGDLRIALTNEANITNIFSVPFRSLKPDPVVVSLPSYGELTSIFTATQDCGLYANKWEDARRTNTITLQSATPVLTAPFNDEVAFTSLLNTSLLSSGNLTGKTFVWVYVKTQAGSKQLLNTFPDIYGQGALWTTATTTQIFGATDVTQCSAYVNEVLVDALSFRLNLNTIYIIIATNPTALPFQGFTYINGKLPFFASWSIVLNETQRNTVTSVLAQRYIENTSPVLSQTALRFNYVSSASINIEKLAVDLHNTSSLVYTLVSADPPDASIVGNVLTYTVTYDVTFQFIVRATNVLGQHIDITFYVDNILRTNPLYLSSRRYLKQHNFDINQVYINTLDTLSNASWLEYTLRGKSANAANLSVTTFNGITSLLWPNTNAGSLTFTEAIAAKTIFFVYILNSLTSTSVNIFNGLPGGGNNILFAESTPYAYVYANNKYVNGKTFSLSYNTINIIAVTWPDTQTIASLTGVKGYIPFVLTTTDALPEAHIKALCEEIRGVFYPKRNVLDVQFNNSLLDTATNTTITGTATYLSSALNVGQSNLSLENNGRWAFLFYDFVISFKLKLVNVNGKVSLFKINAFEIYLQGNVLYADGAYTTLAPLSTFYTIVVERNNDILKLKVDGTEVSTSIISIDFNDVTSSALIGNAPLSTVYLDSLQIWL